MRVVQSRWDVRKYSFPRGPLMRVVQSRFDVRKYSFSQRTVNACSTE